jgi:hypothetical protein
MADNSSDRLTSARRFLEPCNSTHRQYEALRAFFVAGVTSSQAAARFGYTPGSFSVLVHQFRNQPARQFLLSPAHEARPPGKQKRLQDQVVSLRKQNLSAHEVSNWPPEIWSSNRAGAPYKTTKNVAIGTTTAVPTRFARSRSRCSQSTVAGRRRRIQYFASKATTTRPSQTSIPILTRLSAVSDREGSRLLIAPSSRTGAPAPMIAALRKLVESATSSD